MIELFLSPCSGATPLRAQGRAKRLCHGEDMKRIADCMRVSLQDFPELLGAAPIFEKS
jgi:hypothetical protein